MLGTGEVPEIVSAIGGAARRRASPLTFFAQLDRRPSSLRVPDRPSPRAATCPTYIYDADTPRLLATPRHYAYVKIAEGCDYKCAFCIIPTLRGALSQPAGRRRSSARRGRWPRAA